MRFALFSFWPEARRGALTGFGPLSSAQVCSGPKDFGPSYTTRPIISIPWPPERARSIGQNEDSTQTFPFLYRSRSSRNSFWQEILEPETPAGQVSHSYQVPRKTIDRTPVDDLSFEDFLGEELGAKSRKSLRYDQRKLAEQGGGCD